jgi:serine/threonine protein kinase
MMDAERKCVAREVDILRHVDCPEYIITLTACFITGGVVSLVMPLLQSNLYHLYAVRFTEGFSDEEVRTVAVRMLRALKYLHATLHVVHRDVKPENIFLRIGGDVRTCVLADVGHSRSLDTGQLASTVNGCLGTPRFAPPEFAQTKPHTHAVDVYQLGASLVVLLICAGPGRVADQLTLFGDQMHFDVPEWAALVRAGGASGKARKACVERMMSIAPAMRGSASVNLQDPWVSGAVPAVDA